MKRTLFLLLLLLSTPAFAITINTLDLNEIDDTTIEITAPVWDGSKAGPVLVGTFESKFDRKVAGKLGGGFRNAMMPSYDLAPTLDLGQVFAEALRAEGTKLGLTMMSPQEAKTPQWTIDGTIHGANIDIQHMGYGSLLFYTYLDVEVRVTKQGAQPVTHRIRPARLFVMYNGGMGIGDEVQASLVKILVVGAQQVLARLNREHFEAPALPTMETRLAGLKKIDDRGEEDDDVRYATIIALASTGTPEALALVREKGAKDKTLVIRKLSERLLSGR